MNPSLTDNPTARLLRARRSTLSPEKLEFLRQSMPEEFAAMEAELHVNQWLSKFVCDEKAYPALAELKQKVRMLAEVDDPVLITGETGTGKELLANALHGERGEHLPEGGKFIAVNCAGLPENLVESILFGHKAGAFTGSAKEDKTGVLQAAWKGTVFLDEIGELSLTTQAKLLRALQERVIHRVGGEHEKPITLECRIVAATHRKIKEEGIASGWFREDLYWRISTFLLQTIPLRDRALDIPCIIKHLIIKEKGRVNYEIEDIEDFCEPIIRHRDKLTGNVRQLEQIVRQYHVLGIKPKFE